MEPEQICTNVGLDLRWKAGLSGIEAMIHFPDNKRPHIAAKWSGAVSKMIRIKGGGGGVS